jgi:hypothetical protein
MLVIQMLMPAAGAVLLFNSAPEYQPGKSGCCCPFLLLWRHSVFLQVQACASMST